MGFLRSKGGLRLFFATDFHGSTLAFRKLLSAPSFYGADVMVVGGDLTGKRLIPLAPGPDGDLRQAALQDEAELEGSYVWRPVDGEDEEQAFVRLACERLGRWLARAEEVLGRTGTRCFIIAGNDDPPEVAELLAAHPGPCVRSCEGRFQELADGYLIGGMGWTTPTPWHTFREATEEELANRLRDLMASCPEPARAILDVHVPPYGVLDECPLLDSSVDPPRPLVRGGQIATGSVGSHAVRQLILEWQPLLALCGHVHESKGAVKLGRTLVVNPGSEYHDGVLRGVLIRLEDGRVANYQLTSG